MTGSNLQSLTPLVVGWMLGAHLLVAFTLTGLLLYALLVGGFLLPAVVNVLP